MNNSSDKNNIYYIVWQIDKEIVTEDSAVSMTVSVNILVSNFRVTNFDESSFW